MAQLTGKEITIVPRIPYVPIEPWDWFKENGIEDKQGGPPPMGAGPVMTPSIHIKDGRTGFRPCRHCLWRRHHRRNRFRRADRGL